MPAAEDLRMPISTRMGLGMAPMRCRLECRRPDNDRVSISSNVVGLGECPTLIRTPSIECRELVGEERPPFERFTSRHTIRRCRFDADMRMFGVSLDGRPAGLAVVGWPMSPTVAALESIFVDPERRRRGVGGRLLEFAVSTLARTGTAKIDGRWYHDAPGASTVAALLAGAGWSTPVPTSTMHRAGRRLLDQVDRSNRPCRYPVGFRADDWSSLSMDDQRRIAVLGSEHRIPRAIRSDTEAMLAVSEGTSVVLRQGSDIVGWMLHHQLGSETLRYSSLWLRPDLIGRGLWVTIAIDSGRRHLGVADRFPRLIFMVERGNDDMDRFIARRLQAGLDRSSILMHSERSLGHAAAAASGTSQTRP
jgi:GNAT superfamily N-acetyltransferase